ncbi:MAG: hypothetical protein BKP49_06280 [Treponema sp. CETP13]|nr:MAG: hypothetical protein BKP49_06280 [Treponema sp. CETP13]
MVKLEKVKIKQNYSVSMFFSIAIPIMIQGLVFQLQNIVDKAFLGNLKTEYLTAIGVTQSPFHMTMTLIMAISTGLSIIVGHQYGANKMQKMKESIASTITYSIIFALILMSIWFIFGEKILILLNVDKSVLPYALTYIKIIVMYLPFFAIDGTLQGALQAFGKTQPIMYAGIVKVFLNIFLDWVLIFGKFGLPPMGIEGAAIATLAANIATSCIVIFYFTNAQGLPIKMHLSQLIDYKWKLYTQIAAIGLPSGMEFFLWHFGNIVLISFLNKIDIMGVAVYVLVSTINGFVMIIYLGIAKTSMTLIAQQLGAKDYDSTRPIIKRSILYNLVVITLLAFLIKLFTVPILEIFTNDNQLIGLALPLIIYILITLYPKSINVIIGHGIRATGNTRWMLYTQIIGTALVIIMSYVLINLFNFGLAAIFITVLADETVRAVINTIYFLYITNKKRIATKIISVQ